MLCYTMCVVNWLGILLSWVAQVQTQFIVWRMPGVGWAGKTFRNSLLSDYLSQPLDIWHTSLTHDPIPWGLISGLSLILFTDLFKFQHKWWMVGNFRKFSKQLLFTDSWYLVYSSHICSSSISCLPTYWQYCSWTGSIKPSPQHFQFCRFGLSLGILIFYILSPHWSALFVLYSRPVHSIRDVIFPILKDRSAWHYCYFFGIFSFNYLVFSSWVFPIFLLE
jgi:hypothetical protein